MKSKIRKSLLIYPRFQLSLMLVVMFLLSGLGMVIGYQTYSTFEHLKEVGMQAQLPGNHVYFRFLEHQMDALMKSLGIGFTVAMVLCFFVILLFSHKLAGPIIRLRKHFQSMAETGTVEKVSFRKQDFFSDLPEAVNSALKKISKEEQGKK